MLRGRVRQDDGKLVTAVASHDVALAYEGSRQAVAYGTQNFVTGRVPVGVIDVLEVIEVDHYQCDGLLKHEACIDALLDRRIEGATIVGVGKRIPFHFFLRGHKILAQARHPLVQLLQLLFVLLFLLRKRLVDFGYCLRKGRFYLRQFAGGNGAFDRAQAFPNAGLRCLVAETDLPEPAHKIVDHAAVVLQAFAYKGLFSVSTIRDEALHTRPFPPAVSRSRNIETGHCGAIFNMTRKRITQLCEAFGIRVLIQGKRVVSQYPNHAAQRVQCAVSDGARGRYRVSCRCCGTRAQ